MLDLIAIQLILNSGLPATVYGMGEQNCGEEIAEVCSTRAVTASGAPFNPNHPTAAIAMPVKYRMRPREIWLRVEGGPCVKIFLTDKMNARYVGERGFDLTPASVKLLTGKEATNYWSDRVFVCRRPV